MHRPSLPALALALALVALPGAAAAEVVGLLPASGVNVDDGTLAGAREVLRSHLARTGLEVRLVEGPGDPFQEPTPAQAVAAAREGGAGRAAVLRLVGLGSTLRARLTVYDVKGGGVAHEDDMAAETAADLDPALERLAKGYLRRRPAASLAEIDTVTARESRPVQRVEAARSSGFRLQMIFPASGAPSNQATGLGWFWSYDTREFLVDLAIDGAWGSGLDEFTVGVGASYPFGRTNVGPYAGGGIRYAWVSLPGPLFQSSNSGFQPYLAAGLLAGRLSTVSLRVEAQYWWNAFHVGGERASGAGLSLGVGF